MLLGGDPICSGTGPDWADYSETSGVRFKPIAITLFATMIVAGSALAFHDGGAATCSGCHVVHNSIDGKPVTPGPGNNYLLLAENSSDVCLSCHAREAGSVLGLNPLLPPAEKGGGNFVFLTEENLNDAESGRFDQIPGAAAGHSVVAPAYGLVADFRYAFSPGGNFPARELGCTSCHDPHGRGAFRMLYGVGEVQGGIHSFSAPAPDAVGIGLRNDAESRTSHTAYRAGMSRWCGNCHGRYHDRDRAEFQHPSDRALGFDERQQYSAYEGDDNPLGGTSATASIPEVPIEDATNAVGSTAGPSAAGRVMCLSCHRAHASSAPAAGRWDFNVARLEDDGLESGSWPLANPYGPNQGTLCRKCHRSVPSEGS